MKKSNLIIRKLVQVNLLTGAIKAIDAAGWQIDNDLIEKHFPVLLNYCKNNYYLTGLKKCRHLLEKLIETNNISLIGQFDESLFDRKLFNKYGDKLIPVFCNERFYFLRKNNELFNYCVEKNIFKIMHVFGPEVLTEERINKYKEQLLKEAKKNPFLFEVLSESKTFLKYVLSKKEYNLLPRFQDELCKECLTADNKKAIIKSSPFGIPLKRSLLNDPEWFTMAVQEKRWDLVIYFSKELLTENFIMNHIRKIDGLLNNNPNLSLSYSLANSNYFFLHRLETKQYKLLNQFNLLRLDNEIIYKYENILIENINKRDIGLIFGRSLSALKYVLDNHLDDLVEEFKKEVFTDKIVEQYGEQITNIFIKRNLPDELRDCSALFDYCLFHNKPDIISQFYGKYFVDFKTNNYIEYISKLDYLPSAFRKIPSIYKELLARKNYKLLCQMSLDNNEIANKLVNNRPLDETEREILNNTLNVLNVTREEFTNKLKTIYKKNNECLRTLNIYLLGKKYDSISLDELEKFSLYPDIQENIIKLYDNELKVFTRIVEYISSKKSKYDTTTIIYNVLSNIRKYDYLLRNIEVDSIDEDTLNKLIIVIKNPDNYYDVKSLDDVKNIREKESKIFNQISEDLKNGKRLNTEYLREMLVLKCFGLNMKEAQFINARYCSDNDILSNSANINMDVQGILSGLHTILTISYDGLKEIFLFASRIKTDIFTFLNLESGIRSEYAKMYNRELYKPKEEHKLDKKQLLKLKFFLKPKTGVYMIDEDFYMQVHSLAAYYGGWSKPKNFKKEWLQPRINFHEICTCYIANDSILPAKFGDHKAPVLGFSHYEDAALIFSSCQDISSGSLIDNYAASILSPCRFFPPRDLINKTRRNPTQEGTIHNEVAIERRNLTGNGQFKRLPDYVVYFTNDASKDSFSSLNRRYAQSVQAANDFGIPLVIIDRLKYAKRESIKLIKKEKLFYTTYSEYLLKEIIDGYLNNHISCSPRIDSSAKEYNNYFTKEYVYEVLSRILNHIRDNNIPNRETLLTTYMNIIENDGTREFGELGRQARLYYNVSHKEETEEPSEYSKKVRDRKKKA